MNLTFITFNFHFFNFILLRIKLENFNLIILENIINKQYYLNIKVLELIIINNGLL